MLTMHSNAEAFLNSKPELGIRIHPSNFHKVWTFSNVKYQLSVELSRAELIELSCVASLKRQAACRLRTGLIALGRRGKCWC